MDSSEAPGPRRDAACAEGARATWTKGCLAPEEVRGAGCGLGRGPKAPPAPASPQEAFSSSFGFIQLSLGSAGERGDAEGCPPPREAEDAGAEGLDRPLEDPRLLSASGSLQAAQGPADSAQTAGASPRPECEPPPALDADAAASCASDPSRFGGAAPPWDPLLRKCEPLLLGCLLGNRRRLEVSVSAAPGPQSARAQIGSGQRAGNERFWG